MGGTFAEIMDSIQREQWSRFSAKVPSWASVEGIRVPTKLSAEQCSSTLTALHKASLEGPGTVADLTSGLGVDAWAFSLDAEKVIYNEPDPVLFEAAKHNFALLGATNIRCYNNDASATLSTLDRVDLIYMDPSRRDSKGRKVFLLEDCSPNVLTMLPQIWEHTGTLMLKLSPMADIKMLIQRLDNLAQIRIVGLSGECKELLCILRKEWDGPCQIFVDELSQNGTATVCLSPDCGQPVPTASDICEGDILLEPSSSLLKSGCYGSICSKFSLVQADRFTHLYTSTDPDGTEPFFKRFRVIKVMDFGKKSFREAGRLFPDAEVSSRNVPLSSEELRKRMGVTGGGGTHIFGTSVNGKRVLLVCEKMSCPEQVV